jgi:hypothetical protein
VGGATIARVPDDPLSGLAAPPVFVVGHPRSGTTWTFEVLEAHPEAVGIFESWLFHDRLGLAGLYDPAAWDPETVVRNRAEIGRPLGLPALLSRESMTADLRALASRWYAQALAPGARFLVEKTPPHLFFANVIAEVFPDARFVEVIRDGRDAAVSTLAAVRGWNPRLSARGHQAGVRDVAREWAGSIEAGRRQAGLMGERWWQVRFEDLRRDFDATVAELFAFCGMPCDGEVLAHVRTVTDLEGRGRGEGRFRGAGRVGGWRTHFTLRDAWRFDRVAGQALVDAGYESDRGWWRAAAVPRRARSAIASR